MHPPTISRAVTDGTLIRITRGLYQRVDGEPSAEQSARRIIEASAQRGDSPDIGARRPRGDRPDAEKGLGGDQSARLSAGSGIMPFRNGRHVQPCLVVQSFPSGEPASHRLELPRVLWRRFLSDLSG
ncbi:hypothetical protein [Komagataeibacter kakiaceti]